MHFGIVLIRSLFRQLAWVHFFDPLELVLGSSRAASGLVLGHLEPELGRLGLSWARFGALRMALWSPIILHF